MPVDILNAKKVNEEITQYQESPKDLYKVLRSEGVSLSDHLESLDPSDRDHNGERIEKHDAFERHLMVNEISLNGREQLTVEKLFEKATYLMPELVKREIEAGMNVHDRFNISDLIKVTVPVNGGSYNPVYIPDLSTGTAAKKAKKSRSLNVSGSEYPKIPILYREKSISLKDYGIALDVAYKVLKNMPWQDFAVFLHLIGAMISNQKLADIYDLGITGDGTVGAADDLFNGTSGTLAYKDLVHAYSQFESPFTMNTILADSTTMEDMLSLGQFSDPVNSSNALFQKTGVIQTPFGAKIKLINSSNKVTVTAKKPVLMDSNFAVREAKAQNLLVETDKIIDQKLEEAVISEDSAFSIIADGAIKRMDWA